MFCDVEETNLNVNELKCLRVNYPPPTPPLPVPVDSVVYEFVIVVETPESILNRFIKAETASVSCHYGNDFTVHLESKHIHVFLAIVHKLSIPISKM